MSNAKYTLMAEEFFNKSRKIAAEPAGTRLQPWVEKYRPKNLDDVAAQDHAVVVLKKTLHSANLPHMLFYGPPGTGKTSTILALTKELYGPDLMKSRVLELNASDERGISIVREKVKNFARLTVSNPSKEDLEKYPCPPYKIIILDEADSMTADAQSALRRTMEAYSGVTRFCLICNYVTRIIDPLASRCSKFRFKPLDATNALERLEYIAEQEKVSYEDGVLSKILDISQGDLRKAITFLQSAARLHGVDSDGDVAPITVASVQEIAGVVPDAEISLLVSTINSRDVGSIVKTMDLFMKDGWSGANIVEQLHDTFIQGDEYTAETKNRVSQLLCETDSKLTNGTDEHIQILNLVLKIAQVV